MSRTYRKFDKIEKEDYDESIKWWAWRKYCGHRNTLRGYECFEATAKQVESILSMQKRDQVKGVPAHFRKGMDRLYRTACRRVTNSINRGNYEDYIYPVLKRDSGYDWY